MVTDLFLLAAILCCFICSRALFGLRAGRRSSASVYSRSGSTGAATAADLRRRVEVLERIATDRKTALRRKFLDLE